MKRKRKSEESTMQVACVRWFRLQYPKLLLFSIPNGAMIAGDARMRAVRWGILQSEGALPGVADLFLSVPSGDLAGLYLEAKTKEGRHTDTQKEFRDKAIEMGYGYDSFRSLDEFMAIVNKYLNQ
jgi:hypothetical protein